MKPVLGGWLIAAPTADGGILLSNILVSIGTSIRIKAYSFSVIPRVAEPRGVDEPRTTACGGYFV